MIFENSLPKGTSGQNIRDSPNGSLSADSRSLQAAILKSLSLIFFPPKLSYKKSGGLLYSKNNGLAKLSNGPYAVVTSLTCLNIVSTN